MASAFFRIDLLFLRALEERHLFLGHDLGVFFPHGAAEQVRPAKGIACQGAGDLHHLFLVDDDAVGVFQDRFELRAVRRLSSLRLFSA